MNTVTQIVNSLVDFNVLLNSLEVGEKIEYPPVKEGFYIVEVSGEKDADGWTTSTEIKSLREGGSGIYDKSTHYPDSKCKYVEYWEQSQYDIIDARKEFLQILEGETPAYWWEGRVHEELFMRDEDGTLVPIAEIVGNPAYTHLKLNLIQLLGV